MIERIRDYVAENGGTVALLLLIYGTLAALAVGFM